MRFFLDTEFIENGPGEPITLVSIALVPEYYMVDGRVTSAKTGPELYMVAAGVDYSKANPWVRENVLPYLDIGGHCARFPLPVIRHAIQEFVDHQGDENPPEFWGYYADYDWVAFCQIFGAMVDLPKGWPMYCRDIKQLADDLGSATLPAQPEREHNALYDARWNRMAYDSLAVTLDERRRQIQWACDVLRGAGEGKL